MGLQIMTATHTAQQQQQHKTAQQPADGRRHPSSSQHASILTADSANSAAEQSRPATARILQGPSAAEHTRHPKSTRQPEPRRERIARNRQIPLAEIANPTHPRTPQHSTFLTPLTSIPPHAPTHSLRFTIR
jgi:hypothetical protein